MSPGHQAGSGGDPVVKARRLLARASTAVRQGQLREAGQLVYEAAGVAGRLGAADLLAAVALALEPIGEPTWDGTVHSRCLLALGQHDGAPLDEPVPAGGTG